MVWRFGTLGRETAGARRVVGHGCRVACNFRPVPGMCDCRWLPRDILFGRGMRKNCAGIAVASGFGVCEDQRYIRTETRGYAFAFMAAGDRGNITADAGATVARQPAAGRICPP